jgi:phage terminase Nu1 subunit (DNA packaging protein)
MTDTATKTAPATVSAATLAALLMLTQRRVQQLAQAGIIPKTGRDEYPLVRSIQGYLAWLDDDARRAEKSAAATKVAEARAKEFEVRIAQKMKSLIPADDHRRVIAEIVRVVRRELTKVPDGLPRLMREGVRAEIKGSLDRITKAAADAAKAAEFGAPIF